MKESDRVEIGGKVFEHEYYVGDLPCNHCDAAAARLCEEADCKKDHIFKEVKEEPKTKRVAIIWFGEVPEDIDNVYLDLGESYNDYTADGLDRLVRVIDPDRLRYGIPNKGDLYFNSFVDGFTEACKAFDQNKDVLIIDPPIKPETIEQIMDDKPGLPDIKADPRLHIDEYLAWAKRLIEAEEREE